MACRLDGASHYLNHCWNIVNGTLGNKLQWNFNRNSNIFIQEKAFENVVYEMASICLGLNVLILDAPNTKRIDITRFDEYQSISCKSLFKIRNFVRVREYSYSINNHCINMLCIANVVCITHAHCMVEFLCKCKARTAFLYRQLAQKIKQGNEFNRDYIIRWNFAAAGRLANSLNYLCATTW